MFSSASQHPAREVTREGSEGSWFGVKPLYKYKSTGDRVHENDHVLLTSEKLGPRWSARFRFKPVERERFWYTPALAPLHFRTSNALSEPRVFSQHFIIRSLVCNTADLYFNYGLRGRFRYVFEGEGATMEK